MTPRQLAATEFVGAFEAIAYLRGRDAALRDPRVQAARRRYLDECTASALETLSVAA
ncbi:hypothetical protein FHW12_000302 [Dokdonella fugitiva]|uniref:Uncharacterized protein n=1 Tax=Dokdonella fugitiva TaxID=328517 RepID=A0A839F1L2_9GAMM|nr:hypothetical protein [Dokdonella fugitiva]MBA8886111.1 hypothetical protein [Dokdonella fugitiva]